MLVFASPDPTTRSVVPNLAAPERRLIRPLPRRPRRRARWRSWIACCVVIALAWPSLGLLPWVGMDLAAGQAVAHELGHVDAIGRPCDVGGRVGVATAAGPRSPVDVDQVVGKAGLASEVDEAFRGGSYLPPPRHERRRRGRVIRPGGPCAPRALRALRCSDAPGPRRLARPLSRSGSDTS